MDFVARSVHKLAQGGDCMADHTYFDSLPYMDQHPRSLRIDNYHAIEWFVKFIPYIHFLQELFST
jgi:hypothetical protein